MASGRPVKSPEKTRYRSGTSPVKRPRLFLTTRAAGRILGLRSKAVRRLIARRDLPARVMLGRFRINVKDVSRFLADGPRLQRSGRAARTLGVAARTLIRWTVRGRITCAWNAGQRIYRRGDLLELKRQRKNAQS